MIDANKLSLDNAAKGNSFIMDSSSVPESRLRPLGGCQTLPAGPPWNSVWSILLLKVDAVHVVDRQSYAWAVESKLPRHVYRYRFRQKGA